MALKKNETGTDANTLTPAEIEQKAKDELAAKELADKEAAEKADLAAADEKAKHEANLKALAEENEKREAALKEEADKKAAAEQEAADAEAKRLADLEQERRDQEAEAAGKPSEQKLIYVENLSFSDMRQASTGKWIKGKGKEYLLEDGWLRNQIAAGILRKAKESK